MAEAGLYTVALIVGMLTYVTARPIAGFLAGIYVKMERWG